MKRQTNKKPRLYLRNGVLLLKYAFQSNIFFSSFDKFVCDDGSRVSLTTTTTTIKYAEKIMGMFRFNRYRIQCINLLVVCVCER